LANLATVVVLGSLAAWIGSALNWLPISGWWVLGAALVLLVPIRWMRLRRARSARTGRYTLDWLKQRSRRAADDFGFGQADGREYMSREHRYAYDLDLFGAASIFQRLNACHTPLGRDRLADWLLEDGRPGSASKRQAAVRELLDREAERTQLEVSLRSLSDQPALDPERLAEQTRAVIAWARGPSPPPPSAWARGGSVVLPVLCVAGITAWLGLGWSGWVAALPFALNIWWASRVRDVGELMRLFEGVRRTLRPWAQTVEDASSFRFEASVLQAVTKALADQHAPDAIRRLGRLADQLSQRRNAFWAFTGNIVLLSDVRARHSLALWHSHHGMNLAKWLEAIGELEAWMSLATWAESQPAAAWPEIDSAGPWLDARELAHPLLPKATRVGNDARLSERGALWIVTGSNMSGKSTFLRALGLGTLFAELGLPVPAQHLRMRPLSLVTSMKVEESLADGSSRFHSEVRRLRRCLDWAAQGPSLVLLDEILAGTNSRERRAGTAAVLEELGRMDTITLVSTHDLGLAGLAEGSAHERRVVHFTDRVTDGRMVFDYKVKEGPLPSTNALAVMRAEGIQVPDP